MDAREDVRSILPFLPLVLRSSSLSWPSASAEEALEALSRGPEHSHVDSGEVMAVAISDIRHSVGLSEPLAPFAAEGYALFFDEVTSFYDCYTQFSFSVDDSVLSACTGFILL